MKLNLCCAYSKMDGYVNVDKQPLVEPDVCFDLDSGEPWPWPDDSVDEMQAIHALEHLGETTRRFERIMQEAYRVMKPNALWNVVVPDPRHDAYLGDWTHVRPITPKTLELFSQQANRHSIEMGWPNSVGGMYLGIDFQQVSVQACLDPMWAHLQNDMAKAEAMRKIHLNVVIEWRILMRAIKPAGSEYPKEDDSSVWQTG